MSLRDFNEPSRSLHADPAGNGAGLGSFHTTNPQDRAPNNMPKIVGAFAVALMVGAAGVGLYAYSGSSVQPKPAMADNNLPQPPAAAPVVPPPAPPAQQADNAPAPAAADTVPQPAPVKEASTKPIRHHKAGSTVDDNANAGSSQMASSAAQTRMSADSTQATTQAPAQQAVTATSAPSLPAAPQPSPSNVASNNAQASQPAQSAAPEQNNAAQQQQPTQQAPVGQSGAAQAPAQ